MCVMIYPLYTYIPLIRRDDDLFIRSSSVYTSPDPSAHSVPNDEAFPTEAFPTEEDCFEFRLQDVEKLEAVAGLVSWGRGRIDQG